MDYHGVLLICGVLGAGGLALATACSGPDPAALTFQERPTQGSSGDAPGGGGGGGSSGGNGPEGGTPQAEDPIFGTSSFTYEDPGLIANEVPVHGGSAEGRDCVVAGCHLEGDKRWTFAGTIYSAAQGGEVVPKAEVRIVGPDGAEVARAYTDPNGNFWFEGGEIPAGSRVGVRREGGTPRAMATLLQPTDGGCSADRANCHGTASTGRVFAP